MPPLRSFPEISYTVYEDAEHEALMAEFEQGSKELVRAKTDELTIHLFMPRNYDHHQAIFGIMMDGLTREPVMGEWFGDYKTYSKMHGQNEDEFQLSRTDEVNEDEMIRGSKIGRLLGRLRKK